MTLAGSESGGLSRSASEHIIEAESVELYRRTYMTLLQSRGEMKLKVLEASHKAMASSLHSLASAPEPDLGAFLYAIRRLPKAILGTKRVIMGQLIDVFVKNGYPSIAKWKERNAPGRRRRWYDDEHGTLAVLVASASDVDDLLPSLVAFQIEWNKLHALLTDHSGALEGSSPDPEQLAELCGGSHDDWLQLHEVWGASFQEHIHDILHHEISLRIQMLGGTQVGYARVTRRWWQQVTGLMRSENLQDRPLYFVSSNTHSIANLVTGIAQLNATEIVDHVRNNGPDYLVEELEKFEQGTAEGTWENLLYYMASLYFRELDSTGDPHTTSLHRLERERGVISVTSRTALDVSAQIIPLDRLNPQWFDMRLSDVEPAVLKDSRAIIVNIDYPLGFAAYNILREIAETTPDLRGIYILGKAATLNANVGDIMLSNVVHDEHSQSTYWLDNVFEYADIAPYLRFGSCLDNQRAVTVYGTFLQNRGYLDFYHRESYTAVEMEAGPYCSALYEMIEADRYPIGQPVNFSKLPVDFGIIHYASDTPFTQARTLGARGLSYYGMDSTYASSVAIMRRIFAQESIHIREELGITS